MTSTVTIEAHPVPPNTVVEVTLYGENHNLTPDTTILQAGAVHVVHIHGDISVSLRETNTLVVAPRITTK